MSDTKNSDPKHSDVVFTGLSDAILRLHESQYRAFPVVRLGAGEIGNDCHRDLWLSFRWAAPPKQPPGKLIKIFKRGDREEDRIVADLRGAGWRVYERDEGTGKQFEFTFARGHAVAKLDGAANDPRGVYAQPSKWFTLEAKTHNGENFRALGRHGIQKSFPKHYAQVQLGARLSGMGNILYAARNKDTEEDRFINVPYDEAHADLFVQKAEMIVDAQEPPTRISIDPEYYRCRMCSNQAACHGLALPLRNCRTCAFVSVSDNGKWTCTKDSSERSTKAQIAGCHMHRWIPAIISGEATLKHESMEFVQYKMPDGSTMVDNGL